MLGVSVGCKIIGKCCAQRRQLLLISGKIIGRKDGRGISQNEGLQRFQRA